MKHLLYGLKHLFHHWVGRSDYPLICGLVLHNTCNLRCQHCSVTNRQTSKMTFKESKQVIDQFYAEGGRCLYLEGGEPFLWKEGKYTMEDVVRYAQKKGYFSVIVYTNGTRVIRSGAETIFVSIDGLAKTHDRLRGESFDLIIKNIQNSDHPSIYINFTINSFNKAEIAEFCSFVERIPQIKGTFFYFHTPYYGYDELYLNNEAKKIILLNLLKLKKNFTILNSRTGLKSALRNDWKKKLDICKVYENGVYYKCCRENQNGTLCNECGYLSYAEIDQTFKLKPGALINALKYF